MNKRVRVEVARHRQLHVIGIQTTFRMSNYIWQIIDVCIKKRARVQVQYWYLLSKYIAAFVKWINYCWNRFRIYKLLNNFNSVSCLSKYIWFNLRIEKSHAYGPLCLSKRGYTVLFIYSTSVLVLSVCYNTGCFIYPHEKHSDNIHMTRSHIFAGAPECARM